MAWPLVDLDLTRLMDALPYALLAVDGVGRIVYATGPVANWMGWTPAELVGRGLDETFKPRRTPPAGRPSEYSRRRITRVALRRREGGYVEFDAEVVPAPAGLDPIAVIHMLRPVPTRRAARVTAPADSRYQLFEHLPEAVMVADLGLSEVWLNRASRNLFGIDGAVLGFDALPDYCRFHILDEASPTPRQLDLPALLASGEPARVRVQPVGAAARETVYEISVAPADADRPAVALLRDVSEQHRKEADLMERAHQLVFLLDHLPVGVLYFNPARQCHLANGMVRRLLRNVMREPEGATAEELLGESRQLLESLNRCSSMRTSHLHMGVERTSEAGTRYYDWRFEPVYFTDMAPNSPVLVLVIDVTQRALSERNLRQIAETAESASRRKSQYMSALSHDLRTPVNALSLQAELMSQLLSAKGFDDPELAELSGDMRQVVRSVIELINDMLDLVRFETGQVEDRPTTFSLEEWLEMTLAPFLATADAKGLEFTWRVDKEGRRVHADRVKLGRVLGNLVGNAVKFTVEGSVDVRAEASPDGGLMLTVTDTGPGIPVDQIDRIFDEYAQLANPECDPNMGSGLGLAICRRLVEAVGGQLNVESTLGKGSTFTARYPRKAVAVDIGPAEAVPLSNAV
jgi:signal transduction histidine kinase